MELCSICKEEIVIVSETDNYKITCPRCGIYRITDEAREDFESYRLSERQKANISSWLRENQKYLISTDNINSLSRIKTPSFHERANRILLQLEKITEYAGQDFSIDKTWLALAWCVNMRELTEILQFLRDSNRLSSTGKLYRISPAGWEHLERVKKINVDSQQGFVAMWLSDEMQTIFDIAISAGILDAGYKPHLVNMREHNEKIDDEIIAQIRRSRFIVADFTGHRGGVYYEAGFGKGLGIEVFWACRKDDMDKLHFDIRQYNCIDWEPNKLPDFRKRIGSRIESVLGRGTYFVA